MMGGGVHVGENVLYRLIVLPLYDSHDVSGEFVLLKFDQVLHFYIYFVMSFILAHLLRGKIKTRPLYTGIIIALASIGLSVGNELIEFAAVVFLKNTGVGGYYNTLLDLLFNSLGAIIGSWIATVKRNS